MENKIFSDIQNLINNNDVVLFMKGTAAAPMCGFSGAVVKILKQLNIQLIDVNVLEDSELREGIKQFSDWPTIPQLYIKQEFIGGCDIIRDLYKSGELMEIFKKHNIQYIA